MSSRGYCFLFSLFLSLSLSLSREKEPSVSPGYQSPLRSRAPRVVLRRRVRVYVYVLSAASGYISLDQNGPSIIGEEGGCLPQQFTRRRLSTSPTYLGSNLRSLRSRRKSNETRTATTWGQQTDAYLLGNQVRTWDSRSVSPTLSRVYNSI